VADALSRDFHLSWPDLLSSLSPHLPQQAGWQVWTPSSQVVSAVTSALLRKPSSPEFLLDAKLAAPSHGPSGSTSPVNWASTPFSKPSRTKYHSYKSSDNEFVMDNLRSTAIQSGLDRLKITYGQLRRRSLQWGPKIHASTPLERRTSGFCA
jgi:hypothetical protein